MSEEERAALQAALETEFGGRPEYVRRAWGEAAFRQGWSHAQRGGRCPYPDPSKRRRRWLHGVRAYQTWTVKAGLEDIAAGRFTVITSAADLLHDDEERLIDEL